MGGILSRQKKGEEYTADGSAPLATVRTDALSDYGQTLLRKLINDSGLCEDPHLSQYLHPSNPPRNLQVLLLWAFDNAQKSRRPVELFLSLARHEINDDMKELLLERIEHFLSENENEDCLIDAIAMLVIEFSSLNRISQKQRLLGLFLAKGSELRFSAACKICRLCLSNQEDLNLETITDSAAMMLLDRAKDIFLSLLFIDGFWAFVYAKLEPIVHQNLHFSLAILHKLYEDELANKQSQLITAKDEFDRMFPIDKSLSCMVVGEALRILQMNLFTFRDGHVHEMAVSLLENMMPALVNLDMRTSERFAGLIELAFQKLLRLLSGPNLAPPPAHADSLLSAALYTDQLESVLKTTLEQLIAMVRNLFNYQLCHNENLVYALLYRYQIMVDVEACLVFEPLMQVNHILDEVYDALERELRLESATTGQILQTIINIVKKVQSRSDISVFKVLPRENLRKLALEK